MKWSRFLLIAALCLLAAFGCAAGEEQALPVFCLNTDSGSVELHVQVIEDEIWLFLPSFAGLDQLSVQGAELEWWDTEPDEDGLWYVDVAFAETVQEVCVMKSAYLRTLFLFSDDPVSRGRAFVEDKSTKHENEASASLLLVGADGHTDHALHVEKLRGRGNGSWWKAKSSYQLKLDYSVDLLDTGERVNSARKWLLLAETVDETFLHNRISLDLGRELGLTTMESEFIDLYYDGAYCGTYRLSEKVEVGEGRLNLLDYDQLLETWNSRLGQNDLEALPAGQAVNRFGNPYTYVEGVVDNHRPDSGAYVVEMESIYDTLSDRCYFELSDTLEGQVYALKNPENASQQAVQYISERLQEARNTLRAGGVNPETGRTAAEEFNLDAFARTILVQELSANLDGYAYSSSFFLLPAGEMRFEPGPLWDFDLAYRNMLDESGRGSFGFKDQSGWITEFYSVPEFLETAQRIYMQELYPLVRHVLLGDQPGKYLKPFEEYVQQLEASVRMNWKIWEPEREWRFLYRNSPEEEIRELRAFIDQRSEWLYQAFSDLKPAEEKHIALWMDVSYTNPDDGVRLLAAPWQNYAAQPLQTQQLSEATEEAFARWKIEAVISARDGSALEGYTVTLNGTPMTVRPQADGTLRICAEFDDESYRPVDYYGEDVGLVFDYEQYIRRYPEVAEECGDDVQAVMDWFFDEGVYEGQMGNAFFDPWDIYSSIPYAEDYLGEEWSMYYWEFISTGYGEGWMENTVSRFAPAVEDAPGM